MRMAGAALRVIHYLVPPLMKVHVSSHDRFCLLPAQKTRKIETYLARVTSY